MVRRCLPAELVPDDVTITRTCGAEWVRVSVLLVCVGVGDGVRLKVRLKGKKEM